MHIPHFGEMVDTVPVLSFFSLVGHNACFPKEHVGIMGAGYYCRRIHRLFGTGRRIFFDWFSGFSLKLIVAVMLLTAGRVKLICVSASKTIPEKHIWEASVVNRTVKLMMKTSGSHGRSLS